MKILFKIADLVYNAAELDEDTMRKEAFDELTSEMEERDLSLYENWEKECFLWGHKNPEVLRRQAESWNQSIQNNFWKAFLEMFNAEERLALSELLRGDGNPTVPTLPMDDANTYKMKLAAKELDNSWTPYGNHGVYINGDLRPMLPDIFLKDVLEHPKEYCIMTVYFQ